MLSEPGVKFRVSSTETAFGFRVAWTRTLSYQAKFRQGAIADLVNLPRLNLNDNKFSLNIV